jgi:hypothetical protein
MAPTDGLNAPLRQGWPKCACHIVAAGANGHRHAAPLVPPQRGVCHERRKGGRTAQQAQQQNIASQDPTAQVILKTQMAETERKQKESEARMQIDVARDKQNYELKIAELQRQVLELQGRYETQTTIDNQKNATQIALADINNSSKERIAEIAANAQLTSDQLSVQHEQDMLARQATIEAQQSIQNHGIEIQQQQVDHMAQIAQQAQQAAHAQDQAQQQAGLDAALQQQQAQLQPPTPPTQGQ